MTTAKPHNLSKLYWIIALLITFTPICITTMIYWPGLNGPFLLDDKSNIAPLEFDTLTVDALLNVASNNDSGMLGRPISVLSLALTQYFSDNTPFYFKYTNLMIHCMIGMLLLWLTARILLTLYPQQQTHAWAVATIVASLWLIHPLNVSTVLYAVQRMAQLATFFTITGILCFLIARQALAQHNRKLFWIGVLGVTAAYPLAIFSKESGALLPLYIGALELLIFTRKDLPARLKTDITTFHIIWVVLPLLFGGLYLAFNYQVFLNGYQTRDFGLSDRLLTQVHAIFFYIQLILVPRLKDMSLFHDYYPITTSIDITTALLIASLTAAIVWSIAIRQQHPLITLGIFWFLLSHLMESTFIPLELIFEHRNYTAMYGLLLPTAYYLIPKKSHPSPFNKIRIATTISIILLLSIQTVMRVDSWKSNESLLTITEIDHPNSSRVQSQLANLYFEKGDFPRGFSHLQKAEKLSPHDPGISLHQLQAFCYSNEIPRELIAIASEKLKNNSFTPYALSGIDTIIQRKRLGQCEPADPVIMHKLIIDAIEGVLKRNSSKEDLSFLKLMQARTYLLQNNFNAAMISYDQSYKENPNSLFSLYEMADIQIGSNHLDAAKKTLSLIASNEKGRSLTEKHKIDNLTMLLNAKITNNNTSQQTNAQPPQIQ